MNALKKTITVRHKESGILYLVDVVIAEFITHQDEIFQVAYDDKNSYEPNSKSYNELGKPELIWVKI